MARERKRSVKFKDREVVSRISESETSDLNGGATEGVKVPDTETHTENHGISNGGEEEGNRITVENRNPEGSKEASVAINGASNSSSA